MRALSSILAVAVAGCTFGEPETTLVVKGVSTPALLALNPASVLPRVSLCGDPVVPPAVAPEFSILGDGFEFMVVRPEGSVSVAIPTVTIIGPATVVLDAALGGRTLMGAALGGSPFNFTLPPAGTYAVRVARGDGQVAELADALTIFVSPQLTASPNGHCVSSETVLDISGSGFDPASPPVVTSAGQPLSVRVLSAFDIVVRLPAPLSAADVVLKIDMGCLREVRLPAIAC